MGYSVYGYLLNWPSLPWRRLGVGVITISLNLTAGCGGLTKYTKRCDLTGVNVTFVESSYESDRLCRERYENLMNDDGMPVSDFSTIHGCASKDMQIITVDDMDTLYHEFNHLRDWHCAK